MNASIRIIALLLSIVLSACDGGSDVDIDAKTCTGITAAGATTSSSADPGCSGCSVTNDSLAADGDVNTFASMAFTSTSIGGAQSLRATAPVGVEFPLGNYAGAFVTFTEGGLGSATLTIHTYLDEVEQESDTAYSCGAACYVNNNSEFPYFNILTTKAFDAVEFRIQGNSGTTQTTAQVREICSNGDPADGP